MIGQLPIYEFIKLFRYILRNLLNTSENNLKKAITEQYTYGHFKTAEYFQKASKHVGNQA